MSPLFFQFFNIYGKFRAYHLTKVAINAIPRIFNIGDVVALFIKVLGHLQNIPGTILHTEGTALTAVFNNRHLSTGNFNIFIIQWFPPILHMYILINWCKLVYSQNKFCIYITNSVEMQGVIFLEFPEFLSKVKRQIEKTRSPKEAL